MATAGNGTNTGPSTRTPVDFDLPVRTTVLKNKNVLITGGASGLGAALAEAFCKHGAHVTIADIQEERGRQLVEDLKGESIRFVKTDVTSWESQVNAFKTTAFQPSISRGVDIVVAAAGVEGAVFMQKDEVPVSVEHDPPKPAAFDRVFDVNAKGVYMTAKLAQHYFGVSDASNDDQTPPYKKTLVLYSSIGGYLEINVADYCASKWAVRGLFRSIRSMMEDRGYRTNLLAPWVMDTPMSKDFAAACRQQGIPVGKVSDVVEVTLRCAADESICGRAIGVGAAKSFDLEDDIAGHNAGPVMAAYLEGEAKTLMQFMGQRP